MFIASDSANVDSALFNTGNIRADCRLGIETVSHACVTFARVEEAD